MAEHNAALLKRLGVELPETATILDFGCGAGGALYDLLDAGFQNVHGFDIVDCVKLRSPDDRRYFAFNRGGLLPFGDRTFDFVYSNQVLEHVQDQGLAFREICRVLRPGGHAFHIFPARWIPIEPHMHVPFASVFGPRWWFKFWALCGVRNEHQQGLSASQVADRNAIYFAAGINYIDLSCYRALWNGIGYSYRFVERELLGSSAKLHVRALAALSRVFVMLPWLHRTFRARVVYMQKPF